MGILDKIFGRKPLDPEARKRHLLASGRITDGIILDAVVDSAGEEIVQYMYTLNGVDFESSDILTADQRANRVKYAPGAKVGIRYDQRNQGNSVVE